MAGGHSKVREYSLLLLPFLSAGSTPGRSAPGEAPHLDGFNGIFDLEQTSLGREGVHAPVIFAPGHRTHCQRHTVFRPAPPRLLQAMLLFLQVESASSQRCFERQARAIPFKQQAPAQQRQAPREPGSARVRCRAVMLAAPRPAVAPNLGPVTAATAALPSAFRGCGARLRARLRRACRPHLVKNMVGCPAQFAEAQHGGVAQPRELRRRAAAVVAFARFQDRSPGGLGWLAGL